MAANLGSYAPSETVRFYFATAAADGGREAFSAALEEADFVIVKDGAAMTLDASTITHTDGFNSDAGISEIEVDMSNDADFTWGSRYWMYVHPSDETIDSQSVAGVVAYWDTFGVPNIQGTLSGTHSDSSADLGTNAPANNIVGMTLYFPLDEESRIVESYNTGTGVASWTTALGSGAPSDADPWILIPSAPIDAVTLSAITSDVVGDAVITALPTADTLLGYVQLLARSDSAIETDRATELTAINTNEGSGAGDYSAQTDSGEAVRDHVADGTNLTEAGGDGDHLSAIPDMATATNQSAIETDTQDIQGRIPAALVNSRMDATVDGTGMEAAAIAAIWETAVTEAYSTDGSDATMANLLYEIVAALTEFSVSGTTVTIKKRDGATTAMTLTLDDATDPTSTTRAS